MTKFKVGDIIYDEYKQVFKILDIDQEYYVVEQIPKEARISQMKLVRKYADVDHELYQPYLNEQKLKKVLGL